MNADEYLMAVACDAICKYPGEVKDPDELFDKHCNDCPFTKAVEKVFGGYEDED